MHRIKRSFTLGNELAIILNVTTLVIQSLLLIYLWNKKRNYSNKFHMDYIIANIIMLIAIPILSITILVFNMTKVVSINLILHTISQIAFILHVESAIQGYKAKIKNGFKIIVLLNLGVLILTTLGKEIISFNTPIKRIIAIIIDENYSSYYTDIFVTKWVSSILLISYLILISIRNIKSSLTIERKKLYKFWVITYCLINIESVIVFSTYYLGFYSEIYYNEINIIIRINVLLNMIFLLINPAILNYIPGISELSIFTRVSKKNYFSIIKKVMETQKLYLNPKLTIKEIETITGVSVKNIRAAILLNTKNNFNDYINEIRINYGTKLIADGFLAKHTTTALGEKCGFNSHQTFFRAFKKKYSSTPKQYYLENS